jgi:hydrolase, TatD family
MEFIDTHTHLFLSDFEEDCSAVITRAIAAGVSPMLLPNIDKETIAPMLAMCNNFPANCFPMMGLHPTSVKEDYKEQLEIIESELQKHKFVAVGEVGIDLYWDKTFFDQQCEAFAYQIELARKFSLPLVIHCRESFDEILDVLRANKNSSLYSGVFHSFSGNIEQACEVIQMGFKIGINGTITFKNSKLGDVIRELDMEHLLLETDSPFLTPVPKRGQRNESSYIQYVAQKIADVKEVSLEEVARVTTSNAKSLFNLN